MKYLLLCTTLYLSSTPGLADTTFKTCSRSPREFAMVTLDDSGAFHVTVSLGSETFGSSTCKPLIPDPILKFGMVRIECSGDWNKGKGSVILDSVDGTLNVLMYKGPEPLPSQYSEDRALFCGAPNR